MYIKFDFILMKNNNWVWTDLIHFQHSREKTLRGWVNVLSFPNKPSICPVLSLRDYLVRTALLCHADANIMFIQLRMPQKSVSSQTLAQWMTNIMADAGMDTSMFCRHSTHSALAALLETGTKKMSGTQICRQAQWSNLNTTYRKFYHKVVLHTGRS